MSVQPVKNTLEILPEYDSLHSSANGKRLFRNIFTISSTIFPRQCVDRLNIRVIPPSLRSKTKGTE